MPALGWLLNLGFAGSGTLSSDPPTSSILNAIATKAIKNNAVELSDTVRIAVPVKSKNSVDLA